MLQARGASLATLKAQFSRCLLSLAKSIGCINCAVTWPSSLCFVFVCSVALGFSATLKQSDVLRKDTVLPLLVLCKRVGAAHSCSWSSSRHGPRF